MHHRANRLGKESSPYLRQHAHNPVDWYPWGDEALERARQEDLPILVSIGYSACHWCHVMEKESFEDEQTAGLMNANFVCIKIDREERPDLDHIYMDAVQTMTGSGGWPLNVFLTPDAKPFYGGTYFPPRPAHHMPSWTEVLTGVSASFRENREKLNEQAENLTGHLLQLNALGNRKSSGSGESGQTFPNNNLETIFKNIMSNADTRNGGFGPAPKFPQSFCIRYLLHYYYFTKEAPALKQACLSIDKMLDGGIYDQLGGGFCRYSTDGEWLAPHFEKMLYDNALLVIVMSEAYQLTKNERYRAAIRETIGFVQRELSDETGGFYSALDADSEGEEGKFYVWSLAEVQDILQEDAALFCAYYDITAKGNWEGKNILRIRTDVNRFAAEHQLNEDELDQKLRNGRMKLFQLRNNRIRPGLDHKMLLSWNALMCSACCKAYGALGDGQFREMAVANMDFLLRGFRVADKDEFHHCVTGKEARFPAFLDDYAFLIAALIDLQEVTGRSEYLLEAKHLTERVEKNFGECNTGLFYYTGSDQKDVIIRKKEVYDGAIPSGNSVMAFNLLYLSGIFNISLWKDRAISMCSALQDAIIKYPGSFGVWATLFQAIALGMVELVVTGKNADAISREVLGLFIPYRVYQSTSVENDSFPLLSGKPVEVDPLIFLCQNYSCQTPVTETGALTRLMENVHKFNVKT